MTFVKHGYHLIRVDGYAYIAVRSTTGRMHLLSMYSGTHTICGRPVRPKWHDVGAREWYEGEGRCLACAPRVGPYATVRLWVGATLPCNRGRPPSNTRGGGLRQDP